tara:strand:- start:6 stop:716 length:711 start_codon:yes stop_codon:yes gene_type:complete
MIFLLIISIILIILFIVFYFNKDYFSYDENKEVYRIGDILTNQAICKNDKCEPELLSLNKIIKDYPRSFGAEYIKQAKKKYDIDTLLNIIKNKKLLNKNLNYVAIHIRLGDVLCVTGKDKWMSKRGIVDFNQMYNKIKDYYNKYNIPTNTKVKIFSFFHKDHYTKKYDQNNCIENKSIEYLNNIKNLLQKYNINNIDIYTNRFPDMDIIDCLNAKYFIPSGGNFSGIILNLRNKIY